MLCLEEKVLVKQNNSLKRDLNVDTEIHDIG